MYDCFHVAPGDDIIIVSHTGQYGDMAKRKEILERHRYKIWVSRSGRWCTYLDINGEKRLRVRDSRKDIEDIVVESYEKTAKFVRVRDVFTEWNDRRLELEQIGKSTHDRNVTVFEKHYKEFGRKWVGTLQPIDFVEFLEEQIPKHKLTAKAFSNLKTITRGMLKRAKRRGLIDWNVDYMLTEIDVPEKGFKHKPRDDASEVFTETETKVVMDYLVDNLDARNIGLLLIFVTGMRVGELTTLKNDDLYDCYIHVHRTESWFYDDRGRFRPHVLEKPKTDAGDRTVVIPKKYQWVLKKARLINPFGEYVFTERGKRLDGKQVEYRLYKVCQKLGIRHRSPHKIRKTYVSMLLDGHVDERFITDQVGHVNIMTSERFYHRNRKSIEKKQSILESVPEFSAFPYEQGAQNS